MKKVILMLAIMIAGICGVQARTNSTIDVNVLPSAARTFIKQNFKAKVNHIKVDSKMFGGSEYDVILADGSEVEFDSNGNWTEIDCGMKAVPASVVPHAIATYVKQNYKNAKIVLIERSKNKYEIELSNGYELEFDHQGRLLKIDK